MKFSITFAALIIFIPVLSLLTVEAGELETADKLYKSEQWEKVIEAYKRLSEQGRLLCWPGCV